MEKIDGCQLEIDRARGVVYVHSPEGITLVRVSQIPPMLIPKEADGLLDVVFDREIGRRFPRTKELAMQKKIAELLYKQSIVDKPDIDFKNLPSNQSQSWLDKARNILSSKLDERYTLEVVDNEAEMPINPWRIK